MKNTDRFWSESARYLAGEMKTNEEKKFRGGLHKDKEMEKIFNEMETTWRRFDRDPAEKFKKTENAWEGLRARLDEDGLITSTRKVTFLRNPMIQRFAALVLLILAIGIPAYLLDSARESGHMITRTSPDGNSSVDLPDGSRVYMNEGSTIVYPASFENNRNVMLRGEAFFEVMSDPSNPFRVRSGNALVTVLGTSFNVRESASEQNVEVLVRTGKVQLADEQLNKSLTLLPGQFGQTTGSDVVVTDQKDLNYLSWKTREFSFINEPLNSVLKTLEKSYHVTISTDIPSTNKLLLTSGYREQSIDAILETIATAFGLRLQKDGKNFYLSQKS